MEMHVEIKRSRDSDPFWDGGTNHTAADEEVHEHDDNSPWSQLISYAASQFNCQQRLFLLSLGIFGDTARFFRWDRVGVVASEAFGYKKKPELLTEFLHRFSQPGAAERGYDPTAVPATKQEEDLLRESLRKSTHLHPNIELVLRDGDFPIWKLVVRNHGSDERKCSFLVGRPPFFSNAITGRCTRGYVAFSLDESRLMFMKDTWRVDNDEIEPEWKTYQILDEHKVTNILPLFCGDDVVDNAGKAQKTQDCGSEGDSPYIHSRMVQDAICKPLRNFKNSKELVQVIQDALQGEDFASWALVIR